MIGPTMSDEHPPFMTNIIFLIHLFLIDRKYVSGLGMSDMDIFLEDPWVFHPQGSFGSYTLPNSRLRHGAAEDQAVELLEHFDNAAKDAQPQRDAQQRVEQFVQSSDPPGLDRPGGQHLR